MKVRSVCVALPYMLWLLGARASAEDIQIAPGEIKVLRVDDPSFSVGELTYSVSGSVLSFTYTVPPHSGRTPTTSSGAFSVAAPTSVKGTDSGDSISLDPPATFTVKLSRSSSVMLITTTPDAKYISATSSCNVGVTLSGDTPCPVRRLDVESTPSSRRAYLEVDVYVANAAFPISGKTMRVRIYFNLSTSTKDSVEILASLPEAGSTIEAGAAQTFYAFVEYELGTKDEADLFLELGFEDGKVITFSDHPRRVKRGKGRVGSGKGDDDFLKLDAFQIPSGSFVVLRAWLGDTGGRTRLKGSEPLSYKVRLQTELTLEFGEWWNGVFQSVDPSSVALIAGRQFGNSEPRHPGVRITSSTPFPSDPNIRLSVIGRFRDGVTWLDRDIGVFRLLNDKQVIVDVDGGPYFKPVQDYFFQARLVTDSGQVIVSAPSAPLPVEFLEADRPFQPDDGYNQFLREKESRDLTPDAYSDARTSQPGLRIPLTRGTDQSFIISMHGNVVRKDQKLIRCLNFFDFEGLLDFHCDPVKDLPQGKMTFQDTVVRAIPQNDALTVELKYHIAPTADGLLEATTPSGPIYGLADPPTLIQAGVDLAVDFTNGSLRKVANSIPRVNMKTVQYAKTALWAADTYQVVLGRDKPSPSGGKGVAADPGEIIAVRSSWRFEPPIPRDGSFSAEIILRYNLSDLPDDPNFDESKIEILALNPATGQFERLASRVDRVNHSVTASIDGLAPLYGLGMVGNRSQANQSFPALHVNGARESAFAVANLGPEAASVQLTPFGRVGSASTASPSSINLPAGALFTSAASNLFNLAENATLDWVQIRASKNTIAGVQLLSQGKTLEALPLQREPSRYSVMPWVESSAAVITEVHIANPGAFETEVSAYLVRPDGKVADSAWIKLPPKGKYQGEIRSLFTAIPDTFIGYALVSAGEPVAAVAVHSYRAALSATAAQSVPESLGDPTTLFAPYLASGVRLSLVNTSSSASARIVLRAYQNSGIAIGLPINLDLAPFQQYSADLGSVFAPALNGEVVGWLAIQSSHSLVLGEIQFGDTFPTAVFRAGLPLSRELARNLIVPLVTQNAQTQTNLTAVSPGGAASVRVTAVTANGTVLGSTTAALPANGRVERLLPQWVAQASNLAGGYVLLDASQPITAYATLGPVAGSDYASISAVSLPFGAPVGPTLPPAAAVTPDRLDFGNVGLGQPLDLALTIRNTGGGSLTVSSASITNSVFTVVPPEPPFTIDAGAQRTLTVRFAPTVARTESGTLNIATNDPARATIAIPLTGGGPGVGPGGGACIAPPANLVSWYAGDGNANDATGGNNATLQGGASFAAGQVGQAFQFNGSTAFASAGNPANLRLTQAITIEAWINPRSAPAANNLTAIVTKWAQNFGDTADSDSYGLWLQPGSGGASLFGAIHQAGGKEPHVDGGAIPLNTWTHVAMTFDAASGQLVAYVNGQPAASATAPGSIIASSRNVLIGREDSFSPRPFNGLIDEVAIFSRALSASEIQGIFNAGSAGKCKPGGGTGNAAIDVPSSIDFGSVTVGQTADRTLTIRNTGTAVLTVTQVAKTGPFDTVGVTLPLNVDPNSSRNITVRFSPATAGQQRGTLTLTTNDPAKLTVAIDLTGAGAGAGSGSGGGGINLIQNPGAEAGAANCNGVVANIPGWSRGGNATICTYADYGIAAGNLRPSDGGANVFAGGPTNDNSVLGQHIDLMNAGNQPYTLSGWFGGSGSQNDNATLAAIFKGSGNSVLATVSLGPALAAERSSQSGLIQKTATGTVPAGAIAVDLELQFRRTTPDYNDGLADNLSLVIGTGAGGTGGPGGPKISVTPASLDFGGVAVNQTKDLTLTVRNTGTTDLTISIDGVTAPYSLIGLMTFAVAAGGQQLITVRFAPTAAGDQSRTLAIRSNDPLNGTLNVPLTGTGTGTGTGGGSQGCLAPPPNLVSWWTGDGNANDSTGGNNATLQGSASFVAGRVGQAFNFDGSTGYVSAGNPASLRLTSAITIEAWINPRSGPAGNNLSAIVTKWAQNFSDTADSDSYGLWLQQSGGAINLFSAIHQAGGKEPHVDGGTIPLNAWTHVAMTFDAATGQYVAYVNGQPVSSQIAPGSIIATNRNVLIGREDSSSPRPFNGLIDEVGIFNRALSASEIQGIFNAGSAGKCKTGSSAVGGNFAGQWNTDAGGLLTITQNGASVTGTYPQYNGTIVGTVSGNTLSGTWTQGTQTGPFRFVLSADGNSFTGTYGCTTNCQSHGAWNGTRVK